MIAGHRWEYDFNYSGYKCVKLPIGGVESHQWCVGCDCHIGDIELCEIGVQKDDRTHLMLCLDWLAYEKGFPPIEAGTLAEWKLRKVTTDDSYTYKVQRIQDDC